MGGERGGRAAPCRPHLQNSEAAAATAPAAGTVRVFTQQPPGAGPHLYQSDGSVITRMARMGCAGEPYSSS